MSFTRPQSEVGLYGATYKVLEILVQFPYLFLGLLLPIFTKFFHLNKNLFNMAIQKGMDFFLILITPIIGATLVLGEKVMITLAGPDFAGSGNILRILIFAAGMIYLSALFGYAIVAGDLQKKMIRFYLINAFLSLPLYLIFIPIYSYWAAAIITVATESIMALSSFYIVKKHAGATINFKILGKTTLATLAMCAVLLVMINANLVSLIALGLIIYLMVLYALKGITKEMIQETLKVRNN
ncbi:MAG: polysaccharide biosynthesis C-terminal domain-containing protein [bacterium]